MLKEIDNKIKPTKDLIKIIPDYRCPDRIQHSLSSMLKPRIYGIVLGYEDLNDHDTLRHDPTIKTAVGSFTALS